MSLPMFQMIFEPNAMKLVCGHFHEPEFYRRQFVLEAPILFWTRSLHPITCYGKPVEPTNEVAYPLISDSTRVLTQDSIPLFTKLEV